MNRIDAKFQRLKQEGRKALIPFIVAGDGGMETTVSTVLDLEASGADLVELGMPFSDPIADGPAIQRAAGRALGAGYTTKGLFRLLKRLRERTDVPIVLMGYFNPILSFGVESFCREAAESGADGLLVVDLPLEQMEELKQPYENFGLHPILLAAPTSGKERMQRIAERAGGFLYYVSLTGVTGSSTPLDLKEIHENVALLKSRTNTPVAVGFGISGPEDAREAGRMADAVVVGSALVRVMESFHGKEEMKDRVREFVRELRSGLDGLETPEPQLAPSSRLENRA